MTSPSNQIWAYLHNELSSEEKMLFEQALQKDPGLRKTLEDFRITHHELTDLLPLPVEEENFDSALEGKLLAEWENEYPEFAEAPAEKPHRNILRFTLPLAAAAALVILFSLPWNSAPVHWQRTAYGSAPKLRGEPVTQPHYTRTELKQAVRELQQAVKISADQPERWKLQIRIQELAHGSLEVEVTGNPHRKNNGYGDSVVWKERFQGLEDFHQKVPLFGKQIADDLAGQNRP